MHTITWVVDERIRVQDQPLIGGIGDLASKQTQATKFDSSLAQDRTWTEPEAR